MQSSLALFQRVFEYLDLPVDIDERHKTRSSSTREPAAGRVVRAMSASLRARRPTCATSISWAGRARRSALVGETGEGKTTIGYLVARLYDVDGGAVLIDGTDLRDLTLRLAGRRSGWSARRRTCSTAASARTCASQSPDATDAELEAAARAARIHDILARLPDGYDTVVGERGYRFSGGEKQRLAIARAILRDPPVMVLDEATSALDVETERAVQEALDELSRAARRS